MKRRILILFVALLMNLGYIWPAAAATSFSLTVSDRGTAFSLIQQTASTYFEVSGSDIRPYQSQAAPTRIFSTLYLASETGSSPQVIWERHKGRGWGRIAKERGLPPNFHGKFISSGKRRYATVEVVPDSDFEEMMTIRFLTDYYGADPEVIHYWVVRGLSYDDLFLGFNLAARIHRQPREFFSIRISGHDWKFIAQRYRVPYVILSQPVQPVRKIVIRRTVVNDSEYNPEKQWGRKKHGR